MSYGRRWIDLQSPQTIDSSIPEAIILKRPTHWPLRGKDPTPSLRECVLARDNRRHQGIHQEIRHMSVDKAQSVERASHPS